MTKVNAAQCICRAAAQVGAIARSVSCEGCGSTDKALHAHHDDYDQPLLVRWLCSACHRQWHRREGSGKNSEGRAAKMPDFEALAAQRIGARGRLNVRLSTMRHAALVDAATEERVTMVELVAALIPTSKAAICRAFRRSRRLIVPAAEPPSR